MGWELPEQITVAGIHFKIDVSNSVPKKGLGAMSLGHQEITLWDGMSEELLRDVFVHEVVEAINMVYGIELRHDQLSVLSVALRQLLEDGVL
jgi:hypothetical protein